MRTQTLGRPSRLVAAALLVLAAASPARADVTAFVGVSPTPHNHGARGFSVAAVLLILGVEFEYSRISEDEIERLPSLRTWSGNVLVETPVEVAGMKFYATTGTGGYREQQGDAQETHVALNVGGGAKIRLVGPLRVRVDYRVFNLKGAPINSTYQRFYAGGNLAF